MEKLEKESLFHNEKIIYKTVNGVKIMRDVKRIEPFMNEMADIWKESFPDWRFGQLMFNFFSALGDPFYYEEEELMVAFRAYSRGEDPREAVKKSRGTV